MKKALILIMAAMLLLAGCGKKKETRGIELNLSLSPQPLTDVMACPRGRA